MKQTLYSNECISAEKQPTEFNIKSYRNEVFLIISLKTVFENLNLVKSYDKTNPDVLVFSLRDKYWWCLTSFGQDTFRRSNSAFYTLPSFLIGATLKGKDLLL